jgi:hypothetical protein
MSNSLYNYSINQTYKDIVQLGNNGVGLPGTSPIPLCDGAGNPLVLELAQGKMQLTPSSSIDGGGNYFQNIVLDAGTY